MAQIKIQLDTKEIQDEFKWLLRATKDLRPALRGIGEYLRESTQDRIKAGGPAPGGGAWPPLSPGYLLTKKGPGLLRESGQLLDTISWQLVGAGAVAVGSNKVYAAIHQFGGKTKPHRIVARYKKALAWPGGAHPVKGVNHPGSTIPARPFLGVSPKDQEVILEKLAHYLELAMRKRR